MTKNALAVGACWFALTAGYALEQFSTLPLDVTSPEAVYSGGTVVVQPAQGYFYAPPRDRVEPGPAHRELRTNRGRLA